LDMKYVSSPRMIGTKQISIDKLTLKFRSHSYKNNPLTDYNNNKQNVINIHSNTHFSIVSIID